MCVNDGPFTANYELVGDPLDVVRGEWGDWSDSCPSNSAICGISTNIEEYLGYGRDDTALNDAKMYCCSYL